MCLIINSYFTWLGMLEGGKTQHILLVAKQYKLHVLQLLLYKEK